MDGEGSGNGKFCVGGSSDLRYVALRGILQTNLVQSVGIYEARTNAIFKDTISRVHTHWVQSD